MFRWTALSIQTIMYADRLNELYDAVKVHLSIFQTLALLEVN